MRLPAQGHLNWVLAIAWSPDGSSLVSGDKAGQLICWDPQSGQQRGKTMTGHKQWITALAWEPLHLAPAGVCRLVYTTSFTSDHSLTYVFLVFTFIISVFTAIVIISIAPAPFPALYCHVTVYNKKCV